MIKKVWSKNCSVTAYVHDVQFQQNHAYTCSLSPPLARFLVLALNYSGLGFFVSQHTVKSKNGFSPHASMRCGGGTFSFGYFALFIYLFILEAAFDHKSQMLQLKTLSVVFFCFLCISQQSLIYDSPLIIFGA